MRPLPQRAESVYESAMERWHRKEMAEIWPLFGLRVRTPRLVLQVPTDRDLIALADLAADIHDPTVRPLVAPWVTETGLARDRALLQHHWAQRAAWSPDGWDLDLAVWADGDLCGVQTIRARHLAIRRTVSTTSWLHRSAQGRGIGTEMRRAVLGLAFDRLGVERAETEVVSSNGPSIAVTTKLGYRENGMEVRVDRGERREVRRFVLDRAGLAAADRRRPPGPVECTGVDPCLVLLGVETPSPVG